MKVGLQRSTSATKVNLSDFAARQLDDKLSAPPLKKMPSKKLDSFTSFKPAIVKRLSNALNSTNFARSCMFGSVPVKKLSTRRICVRDVNTLICVGIVPLKPFLSRWSIFNFFKLPICGGIVCVNLFDPSRRVLSSERPPKDVGMMPENELLKSSRN